ncbi:MAG: hypothetical protein NZM25_05060 [Leptospiraceae bacterium]|nr:hypothetical protein [Leptospiraceae bacterium]
MSVLLGRFLGNLAGSRQPYRVTLPGCGIICPQSRRWFYAPFFAIRIKDVDEIVEALPRAIFGLAPISR